LPTSFATRTRSTQILRTRTQSTQSQQNGNRLLAQSPRKPSTASTRRMAIQSTSAPKIGVALASAVSSQLASQSTSTNRKRKTNGKQATETSQALQSKMSSAPLRATQGRVSNVATFEAHSQRAVKKQKTLGNSSMVDNARGGASARGLTPSLRPITVRPQPQVNRRQPPSRSSGVTGTSISEPSSDSVSELYVLVAATRRSWLTTCPSD
jgi:hypothetical protein